MILIPQRRNVLVLTLCQAMTSITIMATVSFLVGQELAGAGLFAGCVALNLSGIAI